MILYMGLQVSLPAAPVPGVKEEPDVNQQDANSNLEVKREAETYENVQAIAKRIKIEPT